MTDAQANARCKELALKMTPIYQRRHHGETLDFMAGAAWAWQFLRAAMRDTPARPMLQAAQQAAPPAPLPLRRTACDFVVYRDPGFTPSEPYSMADVIVYQAAPPKPPQVFTILKSRTLSPHHRRTRIR